MKQGNQFYLAIQICDSENNLLDVNGVKKVQFNINELTKTYDIEISNDEVTYDKENECFKIWLTEDETFNLSRETKMEARIMFKNDTIMGTYIEEEHVYECLKEEKLDVKDDEPTEIIPTEN